MSEEKHDVCTSDDLKTKPEDEELDALLDSALQDFDSQPEKPCLEDGSKSKTESNTAFNSSNNPENPSDALPDLLDEDTMKKLMSQFEQTFQSFLSEGSNEATSELSEQLSTDFKKIAEDTMKELKDKTGATESEFTATIAETLKNLSDNAGSLQGGGDDILNMFGALGLESEGLDGPPADFSSFFNNIMQMFLSKDILYPSLKDLVTKYPDWLEENKSTISQEDYTRYCNQLDIMKKVCSEMETVTDSDDEEVKSKRFNTILGLMQQMQEYGHPPKCLMGGTLDLPNWL